jgi:uncharacterized protein YdeI (YjbR/CyaY-like superfamily)
MSEHLPHPTDPQVAHTEHLLRLLKEVSVQNPPPRLRERIVNAENREKAKVAGGDKVDVEIALDTEPRDVTVPADFATMLSRNAKARQHFDGLSYSKKKAFVQSIEGAKTVETRRRRIEKALADLKEGADKRQ